MKPKSDGPFRKIGGGLLAIAWSLGSLWACMLTCSVVHAENIVARDASVRDRIISQIKASQFLHQATYGPNWNQIVQLANQIQQVGENAALNNWIDEQFDLPFESSVDDAAIEDLATLGNPPTGQDADPQVSGRQGRLTFRHNALWRRALTAPDQLRHRTAYALSQILVIGLSGELQNPAFDRWRSVGIYYDTLLNNAFRNYRDVLEDATYNPAMGVYLDAVQNRKAEGNRFPDENYAREFLQLFTVGIFRLNDSGDFLQENGQVVSSPGDRPEEIYDNQTIREFARVFTGLTYALRPGIRPGSRRSGFLRRPEYYFEPMVMDDREHEAGAKTLLDGFRTPDGPANGRRDIDLAIDNAFNHSNCPPFISRLLIQRFTTSNPSRDYIRAVSRAFKGQGVSSSRGDMKAVVRAILMHPEARNSLDIRAVPISRGRFRILVEDRDENHGKLREPFLQLTSMLRGLEIESAFGDNTYRFDSLSNEINQFPLLSPSVFNFYLPDYQSAGPIQDANPNLVSPEFEIFTPVAANNLANFISRQLKNRRNESTRNFTSAGRTTVGLLDVGPIRNLITRGRSALDRVDILFCRGTLNRRIKNSLFRDLIRSNLSVDEKTEILLTVVLSSPDFAIEN